MDTYSNLKKKELVTTKIGQEGTNFFQKRIAGASTRFLMAFADLFSLALGLGIAHGVIGVVKNGLETPAFPGMAPFVLTLMSTYVLTEHYRSRSGNQVEELRRLSMTTTMIFMSLFALNTSFGENRFPPTLIVLAWVLVMILMPLIRIAFRWLGSRIGLWGEPVAVLGCGEQGLNLIQYLLKNPYYGMRPVLVLHCHVKDPNVSKHVDLPVPEIPLDEWQVSSKQYTDMGIKTAIVLTSDLSESACEAITRGEHMGFKNIITVSRQFNTRNIGLMPVDFGGVLGLVERHYRLNKIEDWQIRAFDLLLIFFCLPVLLPLFLSLIIAINLDSKGGAFYRQTRIGKEGKEFRVLKFRTMVKDADAVLVRHLENNPEFQAEWDENHKLKKDPRITRIGRILRKTSLDELPQLWNVVKGEMSLVGPRPIVTDEIKRYGNLFKYYMEVPPGITGLWQVSGRSDIDYEERVSLDEYYVRNRSIWMNIMILIRTTAAVLRQDGAY